MIFVKLPTKYLEQNGETQQNCTKQEKFGTYFCVFINCYYESLIF